MFVEHRSHRFRHGRAEDPRRRRGHRLRHDQRPAGLRLQPGFHRVRRLALRGARREDLQDHGPGDAGRRAGHRPQRFRRRAHPGGRRLARRLCRGVPAQRAGLGRGAADLADHGAVRRRRGLFAGDDRLHLHGEGQLLHVRHRPRRGEDGDPRDRHPRGARRRGHAHDEVGRRRSAPSRTTSRRCCELRRFFDFLPASNRAAAADAADRRPGRPRRACRSTRWSRPTRTSPTTCRS